MQLQTWCLISPGPAEVSVFEIKGLWEMKCLVWTAGHNFLWEKKEHRGSLIKALLKSVNPTQSNINVKKLFICPNSCCKLLLHLLHRHRFQFVVRWLCFAHNVCSGVEVHLLVFRCTCVGTWSFHSNIPVLFVHVYPDRLCQGVQVLFVFSQHVQLGVHSDTVGYRYHPKVRFKGVCCVILYFSWKKQTKWL